MDVEHLGNLISECSLGVWSVCFMKALDVCCVERD